MPSTAEAYAILTYLAHQAAPFQRQVEIVDGGGPIRAVKTAGPVRVPRSTWEPVRALADARSRPALGVPHG